MIISKSESSLSLKTIKSAEGTNKTTQYSYIHPYKETENTTAFQLLSRVKTEMNFNRAPLACLQLPQASGVRVEGQRELKGSTDRSAPKKIKCNSECLNTE